MARWEFSLSVDRTRRSPLFVQISRAIADDIGRGRLRPGDPLPGTRTLARSLGVQRQTVVAAYDELVAEGWVTMHRARGAFVAATFPDPTPRRIAGSVKRSVVTDSPGFDVAAAPDPEVPYALRPGELLFAPSRPDVRLIPSDMIARAYRRAIKRAGNALLSYASPYGHPRLRTAIANMVASRRGVAASIDNVFITRGSQMAIALIARALLRPGDVVAVEHLGYRSAWEAFRLVGADVVPVTVDQDGVSIDEIARIHDERPLRAIYLTPHHQFPTTVALSAPRRLRLLEFAARARVAIIEDDYDYEFHYDGRPVMPLMSADSNGVVVYVGSLSKVIAPGLRIGFIIATAMLIDSVAAYRSFVDGQGDQVLEYALAELFEEGEIQRHVRRAQQEYRIRRDVLIDALRTALGSALDFRVPAGGIGIWAEATDGANVEEWAARASAKGVRAITARAFAYDGHDRPFFRLGFAALTPAELREAVRRFAAGRPLRDQQVGCGLRHRK